MVALGIRTTGTQVDNPKEQQIESQPQIEPRIVPRPEHTLSRGNIDSDALKVLYRLHRAGFKAYLVGGGVRDLLLGKKPKDFDISTDARPGQVRKLFHNSRIIGRRFRLVQVFFQRNKIIEVSTFRRASDPEEDQVLMANNTFGTPAEDALRRDLTINAMFYNIADFSIVDYVGGMEDLKAGRIRAVGDPEIRFHRDPVRVLRAVRHAARTGFDLTPETMEAVAKYRSELCVCPSSRIRDELMRDLLGGASSAWLELAHDTGVLYSLLPTLERYYGAEDSPLRAEAAAYMAKVDRMVKGGRAPDDAVAVAAFLWPAIKEIAKEQEFPEGRAARGVWIGFVRNTLPELAQPVMFAKRVIERACQCSSVMSYPMFAPQGQRLPKRVTEKGYFPNALELASIIGVDLKSMADGPGGGQTKRRRRRRRRKPRKKPGNNQQSGASAGAPSDNPN